MRAPRLPTRPRPANRGFVLDHHDAGDGGFLAFLGLAIDVGYVQFVKTRMQTAADAAALGAAQEIKVSGTSGAAAAARADAALNGFHERAARRHRRGQQTRPPAGYYQADPTAVEVLHLSQTVPPFFLELVGASSTTVRLAPSRGRAAEPPVFYTLRPHRFRTHSRPAAALPSRVSCGGGSGSTRAIPHAMSVSGGATVTGAYVSIVGNYSASGGGSISPGAPPDGCHG